MFGLVISPGNIPLRPEVQALQPPYLRSILYRMSDTLTIGPIAPNRRYVATVNNECREVGGDWSGWESAIELLCRSSYPPFAIEVGNEFDLFWQHNENDVPPDFAADLIRRASRIAHNYGIKIIATSVAGPRWAEYLSGMADLCRDEADYFNIHPYGQRPENWGTYPWGHGELYDTIDHAWRIAGKPIFCTEIGVKVGDAGDEEKVSWWMKAAADTLKRLRSEGKLAEAAWFAWRDQVGAPWERGPQAFGLLREDGSRRPAWSTFSELARQEPGTGGEETPVFTVGIGVQEQMRRFDDEPATDEIYHPIGSGAGHHQYSETFGRSGRRYVYVFSTNQTYIYPPEQV